MNRRHATRRHGTELADFGYTVIEGFLSPEAVAETTAAGSNSPRIGRDTIPPSTRSSHHFRVPLHLRYPVR
jgi:hypothetical protein